MGVGVSSSSRATPSIDLAASADKINDSSLAIYIGGLVMLRWCPSFRSAAAVILLCTTLWLTASYLVSGPGELRSIRHSRLDKAVKMKGFNSSFVGALVTEQHSIGPLNAASPAMAGEFAHVVSQGTGSSVRRKGASLCHDLTSNLTAESVESVQTFVFFIGYPRSGHSIIASMLDAHPNVILAHEFNLFSKLAKTLLTVEDHREHRVNKSHLFNCLYQDSYSEATVGWRSGSSTYDKKGYSLKLNSSESWQGRFTTLKVIGDKAGGYTSRVFRKNPALFQQIYHMLRDAIQMPIRVIHVVRNPFDMIATRLLYRLSNEKREKARFNSTSQIQDEKLIGQASMGLYNEARAVYRMMTECNLTVHEIHYADFVQDTRREVSSLCQFLGLSCSQSYLEMCEDFVYHHVSRTRDVLDWSLPMADFVRTRIISRFPFFHRYSFKSD